MMPRWAMTVNSRTGSAYSTAPADMGPKKIWNDGITRPTRPVARLNTSENTRIGADSWTPSLNESATVRTADRTGVEMEALTAVAVAALALVDMVKAVDRAATITDVRVEHKSGGRSGEWRRGAAPDEPSAES